MLMFNFLGFLNVTGQEPLVKNFTVEDGLVGHEIYETYQDQSGYIWLATDQGVTRYDGHEFQSFSTQNGLLDNTVLGIYEDWKGRIWFPAFYGGLTYYLNGKVYEYKFNAQLQQALPNKQMDRLHVDRDENLWVAPLTGGLLRIDSTGHLSWEDIGVGMNYQYVKRFSDGGVLSGISKHAGYPNIRAKRKSYCQLEGDLLIFSRADEDFGNYIGEALYKNEGGSTYILGVNRNMYKVHNGELTETYHIGTGIRCLFRDFKNNIWACGSSGLYFFEKGDFSQSQVWFKGQEISHIMQDREGGYWISSLTEGIFHMPSRHRFILPGAVKTAGSRSISAIDVEGNYLAIGYTTGTVELRKGLVHPAQTELWSPDMESLSDVVIWNGNVYAGHYIKEPFSQKGQKFNYMRLGTPKDLYKTEQKLLYSFTSGICIESKNGEQETLRSDSTPYRASAIARVHNGDVWVGTRFGLFVYKDSVLQMHPSQMKYRVRDIVLGPDKSVWVLTAGSGILVYKNDSIYELGSQELSNNWCNRGFFQESSQTMWIGTTGGLDRIVVKHWEPFETAIEQFNIYNGLPSNEIVDIQQLGDTLLVATNRAVVCIPPLGLERRVVPPQVQLEGLWVNQRAREIFGDIDLKLQYNENELRFRFVGLSYGGHKRMTYRYKLLGQDEDWIESYEREVRYTNLKPGEYSFMVSVSNGREIWSEPKVLSSFYIDTHISDEWWFRTLLILLLLLVIVAVVRAIIKSNRLREENKRQILLAEQKALRAQMNPHFMFNSLNAIQLYITRNQEREANRYLTSFSKLMRLVLDSSAKRMVTLQEELETIGLYLELEELRFGGDITASIEVTEEVDEESTYIPPMLLQPLLENAIWHGLMPKGEPGRVRLRIHRQKELLVCEIIDDGVGRARALEIKGLRHTDKKSVGLENIRERLALAYSEYKKERLLQIEDLYTDGVPSGTKVILSIPVGNRRA